MSPSDHDMTQHRELMSNLANYDFIKSDHYLVLHYIHSSYINTLGINTISWTTYSNYAMHSWLST